MREYRIVKQGRHYFVEYRHLGWSRLFWGFGWTPVSYAPLSSLEKAKSFMNEEKEYFCSKKEVVSL